jgi:APA family basic amino acid/polyamine antiporter
MDVSEGTSDEGLRRGLTRWHALAVVVGGMLGIGIYIRPASVAQLVGSAPLILSVWIGTGLLSLAGALTYAELAARIPRSGGEYAFLRVTLGELPAFLFGWMRLTVGVGTIAALAVAATVFLSDIVPMPGAWTRIPNPWDPAVSMVDVGPRQLIAVLLIVGLAVINVRGVRKAGRFQAGITTLKALGLLCLIVVIVVLGQPAAGATVASVAAASVPVGPSAFGAATLGAAVAYNGWANVAMVGGEVQDPERNLPWALTLGILVVIVLFAAVNLAYLHVLPLADIMTSNSTAYPTAPSVASRAAAAALGPRASIVLPLLFLVSAIGTLHCNMLVVPRVFFAMARDRLLPAGLGSVSPATGTPVRAIFALAAVAATLAVLGNYDRLSNMATFGNILFFALNAAGLLLWRHREPAPAAPASRRPRWVAWVFLAGTLWLISALVTRGNVEIIAALALMGAGLPVFAYMRHRRASMP